MLLCQLPRPSVKHGPAPSGSMMGLLGRRSGVITPSGCRDVRMHTCSMCMRVRRLGTMHAITHEAWFPGFAQQCACRHRHACAGHRDGSDRSLPPALSLLISLLACCGGVLLVAIVAGVVQVLRRSLTSCGAHGSYNQAAGEPAVVMPLPVYCAYSHHRMPCTLACTLACTPALLEPLDRRHPRAPRSCQLQLGWCGLVLGGCTAAPGAGGRAARSITDRLETRCGYGCSPGAFFTRHTGSSLSSSAHPNTRGPKPASHHPSSSHSKTLDAHLLLPGPPPLPTHAPPLHPPSLP